MVAITASTSSVVAAPAVPSNAKLEQARREADQAEAYAQDLRARATDAENEAQQSQRRVRDLNQLTDPTYKPPSPLAPPEMGAATQTFLVGLYNSTSPQRLASGSALKTLANSAAVINTQGQATGRIVNLRA